MTISTITTETLKDFIKGQGYGVAPSAVAAICTELLAVREAQSLSAGTQFKPVADLYEMQFEDGHTCAFHTDAEKAIQWLNTCDGNKVQEYVKLERLQEAFTAPPAPAVPNSVDYSDLDATSQDREVIEAIAECKGWNACRAAMLENTPEAAVDMAPAVNIGNMQNTPAGFKLVPVEPTEAMINAGREIDSSPLNMSPRHRVELIYRAMLTEAPTPTKAVNDGND
ncbi:hypothetical protein [Serratia fonticola]